MEAPRGTLIHDYSTDENGCITRANLIVGTIDVSTDLKDFTFNPLLELPHAAATDETYHVQITGVTDLAGNVNAIPISRTILVDNTPPSTSFASFTAYCRALSPAFSDSRRCRFRNSGE